MAVTDLPLSAGPYETGLPPATALQRSIADCTAQGWRLQSSATNTASMVFGPDREMNHVPHLVLTLLTCGLWFVVWMTIFLIKVTARQRVMLIMVDEHGSVSYQQER